MRRPIAILAPAVVACLSWVGPALAAEEAGYTDVSVIDNVFGPRIVRVPVGGEVASTNNGRSVHNVVADDGSFRSSALQPGDGFERIFDRPGVYPYVYLVVLTGAFVRRYRPLPVDVPAPTRAVLAFTVGRATLQVLDVISSDRPVDLPRLGNPQALTLRPSG